MTLSSSNAESKYQLEQDASYKFNRALHGNPELRPGEHLIDPTKHSDFTNNSINHKIFDAMLVAKDMTCTLKELQTITNVDGVQNYLRELNKMGLIKMV